MSEERMEGLKEELTSLQESDSLFYLSDDGSWGDGSGCIIFSAKSISYEEWEMLSEGTDMDRFNLFCNLVDRL